MRIGSIGYNYTHGRDFEMDRPNGTGCCLMLLIKTPAIFEIDGKKYNVKENSFVVFSGSVPCRYRAAGDTYTDDWLYFDMQNIDMNRFAELDIPLDTVTYIGNTEELSRIIHILAFEHYSAEPYHEEVEEKYIDILLMKLSRIIKSKAYFSDNAFMERNIRFTYLRGRIYAMPESITNVEAMAAEMNMSRSGFQHLYKKIFGVSVMTDVINGRIDRAKRLLVSTNLSVREVAEKCGYTGEYNFMRRFKDRCGMTPTEYRKNNL